MSRTKEKHFPVSMGVCFWCKQPNNTIVMGKRATTKEAPQYAISGYEPCETCQEAMTQGVTFIEASDQPFTEKQPSLSKKQRVYPSGRMIVVKPEAISEMLQPDAAETVLKQKRCFLETETYDQLFGHLGEK